jgi:uncharacterized membrane protein YagU involved in acid resistance
MATTYSERHSITTGWWIKHGIIGGIIAGIAMMMAEMIIAALMDMDAFMPPRMIAGIVLGPSAMEPSTPLMTALGVTTVLHMMLSIIYGLIFAWLVSVIPALRSTAAVIVAAGFYGLVAVVGQLLCDRAAGGLGVVPDYGQPGPAVHRARVRLRRGPRNLP